MAEITLYLVRHGEAEHNVKRLCSSFPEKVEYPLTEKGREQVRAAAKILSEKTPDAIISSPMLRTKQTSEIIAEATGLVSLFDDRLRETGFGIFDGKPFATFLEKYKDPVSRISPDSNDGVEGYIDMRQRLTTFLDDVKENYTNKKVVIVSHGDTLEQLHGILTHESPGVSASGWYPEKGSCTEVVWKF